MSDIPSTARQLQSLVTSGGELQLSIADVPVRAPGDNEVLIRVEASPINPSDLGLLLAMADVAKAVQGGSADNPTVTAPISAGVLSALKARHDQAMPPGNEGGGVVIAAGASDAAQSLLGKTVGALSGGGMYGEYVTVNVQQVLPMNDGVNSRDAASCFVNPLTALGMVETMRLEGFSGLVHTAAASNLGQMLLKICLSDDVPLVNVVRKPEQAELLRSLGAKHVCDSSQDSFTSDLKTAIQECNAYLAFDATGGGLLADQLLGSMEAAAIASMPEYSRYGSTQHKQVYIYGGLERSPTTLKRSYGMAWSLGGWLLTPFMQKVGPEKVAQLRQRVADEIHTTFASSYTREVSLADALTLEVLHDYAQQATGKKTLVNPTL
ncbi:MAG: zinc-binding dehydrogenase [Pseudomonadaceae bacterium]|nr:zinc-binding dehydrogenase [Pseudomonadaceae bacterium]